MGFIYPKDVKTDEEKIEYELAHVVEKIKEYEKEYNPMNMPHPAYEIKSVLYDSIRDILTIIRGEKTHSWDHKNGKFLINDEKENKLEKKSKK